MRSGVRISPAMVPPAAAKVSLKAFSESRPGAKSVTIVTTDLMPFFAAQSAMGRTAWGRVKLVRTM